MASFIGPPLSETFLAHGVPAERCREAIDAYRERFGDVGLFENEVYPGIGDLLRDLAGVGCQIGLATAKPDVFAEQILEHFGLRGWFDVVAGSEMDLRRINKDEVISWALQNLGAPDPSDVVMVGDRRHDLDGARTCGVAAIAVTWGFGSAEELADAGPDHTVASVGELRRLLLGA